MADMHYLVDAADAGKRIDAYLGAQSGMPSRSACARLLEAGSVDVNGETCASKKYAVSAGDAAAGGIYWPRHDVGGKIPYR